MKKKRKILRKGNGYLIFDFLAQNGEGTERERWGNGGWTSGERWGTVKKILERNGNGEGTRMEQEHVFGIKYFHDFKTV